MKIIFLLSFIISISHAQTAQLCDENGNTIEGLAAELAIPNCLTPENIEAAARLNDQSKICGSCKSKFQQNSGKTIQLLDQKSKKEKFVNSALNEYKKNVIDNLTEALKLRALRPTGSTFSKSISACKMKSIEDLSKGCSNEVKQLINKSGI